MQFENDIVFVGSASRYKRNRYFEVRPRPLVSSDLGSNFEYRKLRFLNKLQARPKQRSKKNDKKHARYDEYLDSMF